MRSARSPFLRQVIALASGTALGQLVNLAFTPITTRLYAPDAFAALAIYSALSALLMVVSTLTYEQAIVVVEDNDEAWACTVLCLATSMTAALLVGCGVWLLMSPHSSVGIPGGYRVSRVMCWLIATSLALGGAHQSLYAWLNRQACYRLLAVGRLVGALVAGTTTVGLGLAAPRGEYLAAGVLGGLGANVLVLAAGLREYSGSTSWRAVARAAANQTRFPRALLPSWLLERFTTQAYLSVFSAAWGEAAMGSLALYMRLIGVPLNTIGNAVGDVVRQRAAEDLRAKNTCRPLFRRAALLLSVFGVSGAIGLVLLAPSVLPWLLGPKWQQVGLIAQLMAPQFAFAIVGGPLSAILANRPALDLITKTTLLVLLLPLLLFASKLSLVTGIALFGVAICLKYAMELYLSWRTSGGLPGPKKWPAQVEATAEGRNVNERST